LAKGAINFKKVSGRRTEIRGRREEGRRTREDGRGTREEGSGMREDGRREEGGPSTLTAYKKGRRLVKG